MKDKKKNKIKKKKYVYTVVETTRTNGCFKIEFPAGKSAW